MHPHLYILNISPSTKTTVILFVAIAVLVVLSAFFSACEMAFSTSNIIRIKNYADENKKGARLALKVCERYDQTLSTILVGNNLVNIACTTIAAFVFSGLILNPTISNIVNTIVMTLIILTFGEIMPKSIAKINPEKLAMRFAAPMQYAVVILYPVTFIFTKFQKFMMRKSSPHSKTPTVTGDELESIINTMEEEGVIDKENAHLIQSALEISSKTAFDIMTHRVDVSAINVTDDIQTVKNKYLTTNYTRLLVFEDDIDHIIGVLNLKDFFKAYDGKQPINIREIMSEPIFIVENTAVDEIIRDMQNKKKHMAVVLDEWGGTSGIVALEDALETVVGEIYDEHDHDEVIQFIKKEKENQYYVDAEIELDDLFDYLGIGSVPKSQYSLLSGFLYELAEKVPEQGQEYVFYTTDEIYDKHGDYHERSIAITFVLDVVEDNRIRKVRVVVDILKSE